MLAIGQTNAANYGEGRYTTKFPTKVYNYWNGKCYVAESPLLGASGEEGEFITQLADKLVSNGTYEAVIIVDAAIGASPVADWQEGGRLKVMLLETLHGLQRGLHVTKFVWHQGGGRHAIRHFHGGVRGFLQVSWQASEPRTAMPPRISRSPVNIRAAARGTQ